MRDLGLISVAVVSAAIATAAPVAPPVPPVPPAAPAPAQKEREMDKAFVLDHDVKRIDGTSERLADKYQGKVILVVNVASQCGYTRQYEGLEALYRKHKDAGLVVLGFPANDFGSQEPAANAEIAKFCTSKYDVTFPMFEKVRVVKGEDQHPFYKDLTTQPAPIGGDPSWNFTKFLIGRDGKVVARFEPKDEPTGEKIAAALARAFDDQP